MNGRELRKANQLTAALEQINRAAASVMQEEQTQAEEIRKCCDAIRLKEARNALSDISVEELRNSKAGIRVSVLQAAGFRDLGALARAGDRELTMIDGIGEGQLSSIRNIISGFLLNLSAHKSIRLTERNPEKEEAALLLAAVRFRRCAVIRKDMQALQKELQAFTEDVIPRVSIRNSFRWVFSGREKKEQTEQAVSEILSFFDSPAYERISVLLQNRNKAVSVQLEEALQDFRRNGAEYYALIESLGGSGISNDLVYSSIPARMAAEIDALILHNDAFIGALRSYQTFGAKYILHQKKILLGDEMGLGKTIQAIAAMCDLHTRYPGSRFLIVCPASVLINWCREIRKFSTIPVYLLHGTQIQDDFIRWETEGGAAVTNYESMGKIIQGIDEKIPLRMLVIDEAHYIKNPDANRTRLIRRLENDAEHILMMTGTPLENRVDEMCALIDFIRPDMTEQVRRSAYMSHVPEFREMIAPFYLRRTREQVLQELPPIQEEQEWCSMTAADLQAYTEQVNARNFQAMRRVSFLQDDLSRSSKAQRLLEICEEALSEGRKMVIYSFFRETAQKAAALLQDRVIGVISGETEIPERQKLIDRFTEANDGSILVCQVQAGGTGLNIQAASIAVFCEPQIKPSLTNQAISRIYRMGQVRNVLVFHLLCENTVDEAMVKMLDRKQHEFDTFADESVMADALRDVIDNEWIRNFIEEERQKYLPAVVS